MNPESSASITPQMQAHLQELRIPKNAVAQWIFPTLSDDSAKRSLRRYISKCTVIQRRLQAMGYNPRQHYFNGMQALIIQDWFAGEITSVDAMTRIQNAFIYKLINPSA